ncbi:hypothetical protein [Maledivibacter halophilus]|uniref:Flp pilus assembly protein TadB n=1 Tax=Maledivibacter halophilus TaxID=36842 RepID=A0A1T5MFI7_9FIRM|nr:hypothetical protein [Maledivibacter halophilus]SKC86833.1 hypothetical protein SAMN02194393_04580 [Maledivibacter halophilus]
MAYLLFLYTVYSILLFQFFKNIYKIALMPNKKSKRRIQAITEIGKEKKDILDFVGEKTKTFTNYIEEILKRKGFISEFEKEKLEHKLRRVGMDESAERFKARQITYPLLSLGMGGLLSTIIPSVVGIGMLRYIFIGMSVFMAFFSIYIPKDQLDKKIQTHNIKVLSEMPRFIRTFRYSPEDKDILEIIKEYLESGESYLQYDLMQVIADITAGVSVDDALDSFSKNIDMPIIKDFIVVFKSSIKNKKENETNLKIRENKIIEEYESFIEEELESRPVILEAVIGTLVNALLLLFITPMGVYAVKEMFLMIR